MVKPLGIEHVRQLIGYALLYDEEKDLFKFTDIGFYHSRSGSCMYLWLTYSIHSDTIVA